MKLTSAECELLPTDEEVSFYREHGWYISRQIIPEELMDDALYGAQRHYAGERDSILPVTSGYLDWKPEDGEVLRLNDYVSLQNEQIRSLVFLPLIGAVAARLSGSKIVRLFHDQLVSKPPASAGSDTLVGWHVDRAYWLTCTSDEMLTAWVPFQDCDDMNGTLMVIDGSHKWEGNDQMRTFRQQNFAELEAMINTSGSDIRPMPLKMKRGQVSFHHCKTIHGSQANYTSEHRISLAIHMQGESNRHQVHIDAQGKMQLHINDILCRAEPGGAPDYADPDVCPVLWTNE